MRYIRTLLILHAFVVLANGSTQDLNPATADIDTVVSWIGSHVSSISSTESSRRAYEYAYIVLRRCHQLSSYQHIAKVHQHLATYHYMQVASEQTDSIIYHDSLAMVNFRLAGDRSGAAKSLAYLASSYLLVNRFQEAEANLFEALGIFRELDDQDEVAGTLSDLSDYFIATESYEDAIKYAEQAEEVLSKSDDARSYGIALFSIVPAHVKLEQYVVAMEKADLAVEKVTSVSDIDSAALAKALGAKALVHQKIGDLDQALSDYMRAWDIVKTLVNEEHEADGWKQGVAEVLYLQQKYAEAIPYYEDYITHLKRRKNKGNLWQT
ncbi:MAG: tetratricopeptide repeat protein, partial [Saprospiraceae bacterium]|nr:tetratricopeptide repeat protein [Saprospiraceae bacterium]